MLNIEIHFYPFSGDISSPFTLFLTDLPGILNVAWKSGENVNVWKAIDPLSCKL